MHPEPSWQSHKARLVYEQAALWSTTPEVGQERIVRLACDLLVDGEDGQAVVALAGMSVTGQDYEFADRVEAALRQLGFEPPGRGTDIARLGALRALCRSFSEGKTSPRYLARWAHQVLGHSGPSEAQVLVELDDEYDVGVQPIDDINKRVREEAERLLGFL